MGIYDKIKSLCKERSVTITGLEKDLGFARGSLSKIDKNKPSAERIQKLADYFNYPVEYFMNDSAQASGKEELYYNPEIGDIAQAIFDNPDLHALMKASMNLDAEELRSVEHLIKTMKETNPDG